MRRRPRYALAAVALALLAGAFVVTFASCATVAPVAKTCAADSSLLVEVAQDLAGPDYASRLEQLVARVGLCIVDRTVEAVIAPAAEALPSERQLAPAGAKQDELIVAHGRAWLAAHPIAMRPRQRNGTRGT